MWLIGAILLISIIDVTGIASTLPFMATLANPEFIHDNRVLAWLYRELNFSNTQDFTFFIGCTVLILLLCSTAANLVAIWIIIYFTRRWEHNISKRLLTGYIYQPYSYFLKHNSAIFIKNVHSEVTAIITGVFIPAMHVFARSVVVVLIIFFLVIVDPILAIAVFLFFGGIYYAIYGCAARLIDNSGKIRVESNQQRFKMASESFRGIKELKVLGKENCFIKNFSVPSERYAKSAIIHDLVGQIPRLGLEAVAFGGLLATVLYFLSTRSSLSEFLPMMSFYAICGYRMLPGLNIIYSGASQIRFHIPSLNIIHFDLKTKRPIESTMKVADEKQVNFSLDSQIRLRDLTFYYSGESNPSIKEINLTIEKNSTVAFVGTTGSGKTTTVDLILGLLKPSSGEILVNDISLSPKNIRQWQNNLGYVPQHIHLLDDSVARNIAFSLDDQNIDMKAVQQAARTANLHNFISNDLGKGYDTVIGEDGIRLSGGQRQRIGIARALYNNPDLLILDEATSALDGATEDAVMEAIHNLGHQKTIITIAHRISTVKECDIIYLLEGGTITAQGTYEELIKTNYNFQKLSKLPGF